uniref:Galectin n=1 Tax=Romanomermis culicivorax TaxID=13658 RepID=A0A915I6S5_ROMCU
NVVRNSFLNNTWGTEEAEGKFPFQSDQCFEVMIVNEPYAFQCFINGVQFCAFAHRNDPNSVKGLKIEGDIELHGVHVK